MIGTLTYWNKTFGFIEVKVPEPIGTRIERYFLHSCQIILEPTEIRVGQPVRFVVRDHKPAPGKLPYAGSVEIFETAEQLEKSQGGVL